MPDFRVPDYRAEDGRLREAGLAAAGLFMEAGAASMRDGTDGWVPAHYVRSWPGGAATAKKLVSSGLWSRHRLGSRDGYLFDQDEWNAEQRLAVEIARDRELAAERARRSRQARKDRDLRESGQLSHLVGVPAPSEPEPADNPSVTPSVTRDADRTSPGHVTPTVTGHVTPERHDERALLPHPPPLPTGGSVEEEGSRSVRGGPLAAVELKALSRSELAALDTRCDRCRGRPPGATSEPCNDCGLRRRAVRDAQQHRERLEQHARDDLARRRTDAAARRDACPGCDEHGWQLGAGGVVLEPATRCPHPDELHAADPPAPDPPEADARYAVHRGRWSEREWASS